MVTHIFINNPPIQGKKLFPGPKNLKELHYTYVMHFIRQKYKIIRIELKDTKDQIKV